MWFSKRQRAAAVEVKSEIETSTTTMPIEVSRQSLSLCQTVYILAHDLPRQGQFEPALAKVATLPVLLRTILGVRGKERVRIIVVVRPGTGRSIRAELSATGRLPGGHRMDGDSCRRNALLDTEDCRFERRPSRIHHGRFYLSPQSPPHASRVEWRRWRPRTHKLWQANRAGRSRARNGREPWLPIQNQDLLTR